MGRFIGPIKAFNAIKEHICIECNKTINKEEKYIRYYVFGQRISVKHHEECFTRESYTRALRYEKIPLAKLKESLEEFEYFKKGLMLRL